MNRFFAPSTMDHCLWPALALSPESLGRDKAGTTTGADSMTLDRSRRVGLWSNSPFFFTPRR
jgi:hypothetical protein